MKYFVLLMFISATALANIPMGSFEGRTNRGVGCYYEYNGNKLVFGYQPDDRPWGVCQVNFGDIEETETRARAVGEDCSAEFDLKKNVVTMTFDYPFKIVRCLNLR